MFDFEENDPQADLRREQTLRQLTGAAEVLSREMVEVTAFLNQIATTAEDQDRLVSQMLSSAQNVSAANTAVLEAAERLTSKVASNRDSVVGVVDRVRNSGEEVRAVAIWVRDLDRRMAEVADALKKMQANNANIAGIASQVNILAINAKIEAARAGDAGRGFAVVAEAINELSRKTAQAADQIGTNISGLSKGILAIRDEAAQVATRAGGVIEAANGTDTALAEVSDRISDNLEAAREISGSARAVETAGRDFGPSFQRIAAGTRETATGVAASRDRIDAMVEAAEMVVRGTILMGVNTPDSAFIRRVCQDAATVGTIFEEAVASGEIGMQALFDFRYRPIPGTDPQQVMAPFTEFTDRVLPPIQEAALGFSEKVVFCAAVDVNGYLPTHNLKFSQPQGKEPVWNAANARNRRIFDDRVGLKAARSTEPFLLQVYRRDMGGGNFVMMKDLSAPILVQGRHWGGLRLAYTF